VFEHQIARRCLLGTVQHAATHCNTLQHAHTATHPKKTLIDTATAQCEGALEHQIAIRCVRSAVQHTATHCNTLQDTHTATHKRIFDQYCNCAMKRCARTSNSVQMCTGYSATPRNALQHTATHCNTPTQQHTWGTLIDTATDP